MVRVDFINGKALAYKFRPSYDDIKENFYLAFLVEVKEDFREKLLDEIEFIGGLK